MRFVLYNAEFICHAFGAAFTVARKHNDSFNTALKKPLDSFLRSGFNRVRQVQRSDEVLIDGKPQDTTYLHFKNWLAAMAAGKPEMCNNTPELGAAAVTTVILGAQSYRQGKVFHFDAAAGSYKDGDASWAAKWEELSKQRAKPTQVPGWKAGDTGSVLKPPAYMNLGGPWVDGKDPAPPEEKKGS